MVESVGNVTRHRRATIIVNKNKNYVKIEVPAISGESIAHGYQKSIVDVAKVMYGGKAPICEWCGREEFFKEMDDAHTIPEAKGVSDMHEFERKVVENCIVEDIGGFLRAEKPPVRRTSRFFVGYMIPSYDEIQVSSLESQFHVRHAPSEPVKEERAAQMIYYVELGSAVYQLSFNIDFYGIGRTSLVKVEEVVDKKEREKRVKVALAALMGLLQGGYGAKRSRFLPIEEVKTLELAVSKPIHFTLPPASSVNFIKQTKSKLDSFKNVMSKLGIEEQVKIFAYSNEVELPESIEKCQTLEEVIEKAIEVVLNLLE